MSTRALYTTGLCVSLLCSTANCSDSTSDAPPPPRDTTAGNAGGSGNDDGTQSSADDDAGTAELDARAPRVEILSPERETDPNGAAVITSRTLVMRCQVKPGDSADSAAVDPNSVSLLMIDPEGNVTDESAVDALPDDVFQAEFTLSGLDNGALQFVCLASDDSDTPRTTRVAVDSLLDLGPTLQIDSPIDGDDYALKSPVSIEFLATPAPLTADDPAAELAAVDVTIAGSRKELTAVADAARPGRYALSVDFDDRDLFGAPPETAEITIRATNQRGDGVTRQERVHIGLDATGPQITVQSPTDREVTRGEVLLSIDVSDPAGVNDDALTVIIDDKDPEKRLEITEWDVDGSVFQQQFDTRHFDATRTQLTLNVRARDAVGNQSSAEVTIRLDNLPPLVSLDPPPIREWYDATNDEDWCTEYYDPVGYLAADDLDTVPEAVLIRALVWDQTNGAEGDVARWYAGVKETSVQLFYRPADGTPLLIDSTDDDSTFCDELNYSDFTETIAAAQDPRFFSLDPLTPYGNAQPDHAFTNPEGPCLTAPPLGTEPTDPRCDTSEMQRITPQPREAKPAGIFAFKPTDNTTTTCDGDSIALGQNLQPGWVCLVARAEDEIGNVGVSRPLRLCLVDATACLTSPPSCTDGCTPPAELASELTLRHR